MRLLVHPSDLVLGGSSLNAIDVSQEMMRRGHEVLLCSPSGDLNDRLQRASIRHVRVPYANGRRPNAAAIHAVTRIADWFRPDLVHTWEFGPYFTAFFGPHLQRGIPQLATVMSMEFPNYMPRTVPVTLGTKEMATTVETAHRARVHVVEPPVCLEEAREWTGDIRQARAQLGLEPGMPTVVVVSRLASAMKAEGILDLIRSIERISQQLSVQLLVVGDGDAAQAIHGVAEDVNGRAQRRVVVLAGALDDPRPAYAVADVVVGMGSSVIRGMAAGKPSIVVGINGFVLPVEPKTFSHFDWEGFWGVGSCGDRSEELGNLLLALLREPVRAQGVGEWGRRLVRERYALAAVSDDLEGIYEQTVRDSRRHVGQLLDGLVTLGRTAPVGCKLPYTFARRSLCAVTSRHRSR